MTSETDEEQNVQTTKPPLAGQVFDDGKGRLFPCDRCGANLVFSIGQQSLQCPYCGTLKQIAPPPDVPIVERDFLEMLDRLKRLRQSGQVESQTSEAEHAIRCLDCGAEVIFQGTLTSSHCPYCAAPLQRDQIHNSPQGIPVDGMLPFLVPPEHAAENLRQWVRSLWWAPNQFLREGANGKFNGVYLPFFTYDALTWTRYSGERGDAYTVTVGSGNSERRERRVRWYPAGGEFQRFFDDVLIIAAGRQQSSLVHEI